MCGFFGVVEHDRGDVPDEQQLRASARLLAHRGPDHCAVESGPGFGLAHTRLSLVDLSARGNQPMWDASSRHCLVFNGEIYNHRALRRELEAEGCRFRTDCDTEVLLQALLAWGVDATLPRLEGMFAFALYDTVTATVVLARDRFGIKPLFVHDDGHRTLFASEIRAFRPWLSLEPDLLSISSYLQGFGGPTNGHTFYRHVRFLPAGAVADLAVGSRPRLRQVLHLDDLWQEARTAELETRRPDDLVDAVEAALGEAVDSQLVADAPVGALCSGGLDSSLVLAIAARRHPDLAIFHANVVGDHSEHAAATALAEHLGLRLRVVDVTDHDLVELMPEVIDHSGHPFVNTPHSVPFLQVSGLVRGDGVKAVLSGEGADECFLGYAWQAPTETPASAVRRRIAQLASRGLRTPAYQKRFRPEVQQLVMDLHNRFEVSRDLAARRTRLVIPDERRLDRDSQVLTLDALGYNLRALLHRNDAMGMARSIEARFPYLDTRLVELAVNLPYDVKRRHAWLTHKRRFATENKWVLRRVADRYLPHHLSRRKKAAFTVDAVRRLRVEPSFFVNGLVAEHFGLTRADVDHLMQRAPDRLVRRLLQLEVWMHVCLRGESHERIRRRLRDHVTVAPPRTTAAA